MQPLGGPGDLNTSPKLTMIVGKIMGLCSAIQGNIYRQKTQQNEETGTKSRLAAWHGGARLSFQTSWKAELGSQVQGQPGQSIDIFVSK